MLTVTKKARAKLKEALEEEQAQPDKAIRLVLTSSFVSPLNFIIDEEGEGDQVVRSDDGTKVLLIGPTLHTALEGMVIDYLPTVEGSAFTVSRREPVN